MGFDPPIRRHRRLQLGHPVGRARRSRKVLQPILDPFHRPPGHPRRQRDQDNVRKHPLLDPKTPPGISRRPQPQPIARHPQRPSHHSMQTERPLEICQHIVTIVTRIVLRHHPISLNRGTGIPRIPHLNANPMRCRTERRLRIAIAKSPVARQVPTQPRMQHRRVRRQRRARIDHRRQRLILRLDQIQRVLRQIPGPPPPRRQPVRPILLAPGPPRSASIPSPPSPFTRTAPSAAPRPHSAPPPRPRPRAPRSTSIPAIVACACGERRMSGMQRARAALQRHRW